VEYGNSAFAFITPQAVAQAVLAPTATSSAVKGVLNAAADSAIKAAFTPAESFYAVGELGIGHATGGTDTEDNYDRFNLTLSQAQIGAGQNLVLGLYGGELTGAGVKQVVLTVDANGTTTTETYTAGQAVAAFTDGVMQLGALAGNGQYDLTVQLDVTTNQANSGFYGGFILGDSTNPPAGHTDVGGLARDMHDPEFGAMTHWAWLGDH
jgi:hypothetical protein